MIPLIPSTPPHTVDPDILNAFFTSTSELVTSATAKPVEALLKWIDGFPEDSDTSFQLRPITCLEVLQERKKLRSDCS